MRYALNSKEMKLIDEFTIKEIKIPQAVLMERAACEVAAVMKKRLNKSDRILVVCGSGNNGGDGIAAGRILYLQGYTVAILFIGDKEKVTEGMSVQLEIAANLGIKIENCNKLNEYNIIIDSIFGVGLARPVTGVYEEIIEEINKLNGTVYSVDIPSGISADSGKIMNAAVKADYTITFGYMKQGLIFYPGADYAGEITVADIGFPDMAARKVHPDTVYYDPGDLKLLPPRINYSNKGSYGKVLIIAGSKGISGAAYLSAKAAYRTGAGLVKILTTQDNRIILQTSLPEALLAAYDEEGPEAGYLTGRLQAELSWADAVVIGPGLGLSQSARQLLEAVLKTSGAPLIIDADAVTLLAKMIESNLPKQKNSYNREKEEQNEIFSGTEAGKENLKNRVQEIASLTDTPMILTPHLMELSRLIGVPVYDIVKNLVDTACQCSYNNSLIYVLKDARTIVAQSAKRYINVSGNNGMATGGSGDVLTGILAALIAQGMQPYEASCLAVYIHGLAGDAAAERIGKYSMMAGDIIAAIDQVLHN